MKSKPEEPAGEEAKVDDGDDISDSRASSRGDDEPDYTVEPAKKDISSILEESALTSYDAPHENEKVVVLEDVDAPEEIFTEGAVQENDLVADTGAEPDIYKGVFDPKRRPKLATIPKTLTFDPN